MVPPPGLWRSRGKRYAMGIRHPHPHIAHAPAPAPPIFAYTHMPGWATMKPNSANTRRGQQGPPTAISIPVRFKTSARSDGDARDSQSSSRELVFSVDLARVPTVYRVACSFSGFPPWAFIMVASGGTGAPQSTRCVFGRANKRERAHARMDRGSGAVRGDGGVSPGGSRCN